MYEPNKRRTEITIETHSLTIVRVRGSKIDEVFCEHCRRDVHFFTPAQAVLIFRLSANFLDALFRSNQIHAVGENAVCAASLADYFKQDIRFVED
jgi:hypothetical protein